MRYAEFAAALEDGRPAFRTRGAGTQCKPAVKSWAGTGCCGSTETAPAGGARCA